jgi:hypothetical protein
MLVLHKVLSDGSFTHEEFTRESWEDSLRDPDIAVPMGHPINGCPGTEALKWALFFSKQRHEGRALNAAQSELADDGDQFDVPSRTQLVESSKVSPPPEAHHWPPSNPLTPKLLSSMTGICETDCDEILHPLRKHTDLSDPPHMLDDRGQWSLF